MSYIQKLIACLENEINLANNERETDGLTKLAKLKLKILGQSALLSNQEFSSRFTLNQTRDLDAIIEGDWALRSILKRALEKVDLVYDDLSSEIWIPPGSTFTKIHESALLKIELIDPFYALVSKAIKAPLKNKALIVQGLALYGKKFADTIVEFGGDLHFFVREDS